MTFSEDNFADDIIHGLFKPPTLKELFETKIKELEISPRAAYDILNIQHRTLNGILEGTQKSVDYTNLIKLSNFLQLPKERVIKMYLDSLEINFPYDVIPPEKIKFIKENFDLAVLKKEGFIDSITDFSEIERKLISRLGLKSILEYRKPPIDVAFSSGFFKPKNELTRSFWIQAAITCFEEINNPYDYSRESLINYFPQIRWYSLNVERGLVEVIKELYKLGITVIYQSPLQALQLRGATFSVNDKPCIVLTNYIGYYATLWFALIHELYHVLFDWSDIKANRYHLTDDSNDQLSVQEREKMADDFARDYLLSQDKLETIRPYLNDSLYVNHFATNNHIHPSIIYVFYAYANGKKDRLAWPRARRLSPDYHIATNHIDYSWKENKPVEEFYKQKKSEIYN